MQNTHTLIDEIFTLSLAARQQLLGVVSNTPCLYSSDLSELTGAKVYLKYENRQHTASFKERGALIKLLTLSPAERQRGIIAMSAGNHAQAVAYHAKRLNIACTIVMPRFTPGVKIRNTEKHGARVIVTGDSLEDAAEHARQLCQQQQSIFIHPYDDKHIIAGQGTIACEMLESVPDLDALIIPVGGGGLISGNAITAKGLRPGIKIYGVEAERYPSMRQALAGQPIRCGRTTLADGIGVKRPGDLPLQIIRQRVDDILLVDELAIEQAVLSLLEQEKTVVEGAGAVALAALLAHGSLFKNQHIGLLLSGGNIDMPVLSLIIQRGMERAYRLVKITVTLRDIPGALGKVCQIIEATSANIVDISHQRSFTRLPLEAVEVTLMLQTRGPDHFNDILKKLTAAEIPCTQLNH